MILDDILRAKAEEISEHKRVRPLEALRARPLYSAPRRRFAGAFEKPGRAIIAEVKKASPSRGVIRADFDPLALARAYEHGGARAISVLTDAPFFQGSLAYLEAIRRTASLPLLRKDFVIEPYQIEEARAFGADAVLLIAAILEPPKLVELQAFAREIGLDALVEVHTREELDLALGSGARCIGINNRDLRTFVTRLEIAETLAPLLPKAVTAIAESGLKTPADLERLERVGVRGFLIGETLVASDDPEAMLRELVG